LDFHSRQNILPIRNQQFQQNNLQQHEISELVDLYNNINSKSKYLSKIFYNYLYIYEFFCKNHKHPKEENNEISYDTNLIDIYLNFPPSLCISIFKNSMPKIFNLILLNSQICSNFSCISTILIDNIS